MRDEVIFYEITDFLDYLRTDKRLSENTIQAYKNDIVAYAKFLKKYQKVFDVNDIDKEMIDKYIQSLKRNEMKNTTISRKITTIKAFHHFLKQEKITDYDVAFKIDTPKKERHLPEVLSVEEINLMLNSIDTTTIIGKRNKAMLELLYATGLRITELLDLKTSDIHLNEKYLEVIGKGNKERIVPIGELAIRSVRDYIENARSLLSAKPSSILFYNYKGDRMSRQGFYKYLVKLAKSVNITKEISPHTIRHSFATHLLEGGTDLRIVQELLGHEDIETTEIYTHIDKSELKNVLINTHPLAKKGKDNNEI